jgi:hypothetical protein
MSVNIQKMMTCGSGPQVGDRGGASPKASDQAGAGAKPSKAPAPTPAIVVPVKAQADEEEEEEDMEIDDDALDDSDDDSDRPSPPEAQLDEYTTFLQDAEGMTPKQAVSQGEWPPFFLPEGGRPGFLTLIAFRFLLGVEARDFASRLLERTIAASDPIPWDEVDGQLLLKVWHVD